NPVSAVFNHKINEPTVLVNIREIVLGIEVICLLSTKGVRKQFNKQILGTAARDRTISRHRGTSYDPFQPVHFRDLGLQASQLCQRDGPLAVLLLFSAMLPGTFAQANAQSDPHRKSE